MTRFPQRRRVTRWPTSWADEATTLLPLVLVLVGGFWYASTKQAAAGDLATATTFVLVTQTLPGAIIWRSVRPVSGWLVEDVAMGTALGAVLAVAGQVLSVLLHHHGIQWGLGWLLAYVAMLLPWSRRRIVRAEWYRLPLWWGWLVALAAVGALAVSARPFSQVLPGRAPWAAQYLDVPYHLALIGELKHRFPPHTPQVASESLDYHWFSHAWLGNLSALSHVADDVLLTRWAPVFVAVMVVVALGCLGVRLGGPATGGVLALTAVVVRQVPLYSSWSLFALFTPISPSTGFALLVGTALVTLLAGRWRGESPWWAVLVLVVLCVGVGGSKGSWLPILAVGCVVAFFAALVGRSRFSRRVALDTLVVVLTLGGCVKVLFRGNDGGLTLTPFDSLADTSGHAITGHVPPDGGWLAPDVVGLTAVLVLVAVLPLLGVLGLLRGGRWRDPAGWLLIGSSLAGLGGVLVFRHPGNSQHYFYQAGVPLGLAAAAWGVAALVADDERRGPGRGWIAALLGAVAGWLLLGPLGSSLPAPDPGITSAFVRLGFVVLTLLVVGFLVRALHRRAVSLVLAAGLAGAASVGVLGILGTSAFHEPVLATMRAWPNPDGSTKLLPTNGAVSAGQVQAMRWIARHTPPDDLVMTNRHCFDRYGPCNNRRFWLAAYSERRVLVEGWGYTRRARQYVHADVGEKSSRAGFWDAPLLILNDLFYAYPNQAMADALYDRGVRWMYAERLSGFSPYLTSYADVVYANDDAWVFRLRRGTMR